MVSSYQECRETVMIWIVELLNIQNADVSIKSSIFNLPNFLKKNLKEVSRILKLFLGSFSNALVPFGVRRFTCEPSIIVSAQIPLN